MRIHQLSLAEAYASIQSGPDGLSEREAARRLGEYGPNEIEVIRRESMAARGLRSITHFFAIILWLAAALAFVAEIHEPGQGMAALGVAIVGVIVVNGGFSFWQEFRAERTLAALQRLLPQHINVRRDGCVQTVTAANLAPGDVVVLSGGDKVPADCRVTEAFALRVNNATITGESLPHARDAAASEESDLTRSRNVLLAGTTIVAGEATALVFATGQQTAFGQIAHLTQSAKEPLSPLQREVVRLSRLVAALSLGLGIGSFLIGRAIGLPFWSDFIFAIGIIVANVPEGLLPTLTLALALGSQRMARRNALVRHLPAVETLGAATVICTDKTGTLTENRLSAEQLWVGGRVLSASDTLRLRQLAATHRRLFDVALHSHDLKSAAGRDVRGQAGDPIELGLRSLAESVIPDAPRCPPQDEIPFDSQRCRMSTVHETAEGRLLFCKGAPEQLLPRCSTMDGDHGPETFTEEQRKRVVAAQNAMAGAGQRVLALAWRHLPERTERGNFESDLTLAGLIGFADPPRPEVRAAVRKCREAGIKIIMITGDHPQTALALAGQIGLVESAGPVVITGPQLQRLSNTQLQLALDAPEILFARVGADQKLRIVTALQRKKQIVAVTGDGVNDAPALRRADIGIAMGRGGTDVARESADIVLLDDNFATIVTAIEEGRAIFANIRKFLTYILTSNIPELVPYLAFVLFKIPLPLTILQILAVDLGTDMLPALALGAEPPSPQAMRNPPRARDERLLNFALIARAYLWLGVMQATAAMSAFFFVLHRGGWEYGQPLPGTDPLYLQATTACLSAIIVMQVANVFVCRSRTQSVFRFPLGSNPLILWGIAAETALLLLIVYSPWGNALFRTAPLALSVWAFILPFALGMLALEEFRKRCFARPTVRPGGASTSP